MYASRMPKISLSILFIVAGLAAAGACAGQLPGKTDLDLTLVTPIDERTTPVDQEIAFKLTREVKKAGALLAPKGATVTARVTQIQRHSSYIGVKRTYFVVGLRLVAINTGQEPIPVTAGLETVGPTNNNDYFIPFSHGPEKWGEFAQYRFQFKIPDVQPGESTLGVVREYLRVPKGLRMVFRTQ